MNFSTNVSNIDDDDRLILEIINIYLNDFLGSFIFILGIFLNLLSFTYFQLSRSFKDTSMRHYLSVLSITDSIRLSEWFFLFLLNHKVIFLNEKMCSVFLYTHITSGNISVWLLVFLSIERYVILRFPFTGKEFYSTRRSLRLLGVLIFTVVLADIPYLLPNFVRGTFVDYKLKLHMCITNPIYRTYMFANNVLFYALIPFFLLLISNCLLISTLARQNSKFFSLMSPNSDSILMNQKRERHFKERTVLLISITFFLLLTISPRYIAQMLFVFTNQTSLFKVIVAKCLFILEMLNFSSNFIFYIVCSKTSRNEFYLIMYYFCCWKWSKKSKMYYNDSVNKTRKFDQLNRSSLTTISILMNDQEMNFYNMTLKNSKTNMNCFLMNAARLKSLRSEGKSITSKSKKSVISQESPTENILLRKKRKLNRCLSLNTNGTKRTMLLKNRLRHMETIA